MNRTKYNTLDGERKLMQITAQKGESQWYLYVGSTFHVSS